MRWSIASLVFFLAAPSVAGAQDCPPNPDIADEVAAIYTELQTAQNEMDARPLANLLWRAWTRAPDQTAQDMLDVGMAAREVFDFERAKGAFDALVAYCPDYPEGYNQRAFIAFLREDYVSALSDLERTLERDPTHVAAIAGLGLTLTRLGRDEAAQAVLKRAVKLNPWLSERHLIRDAESR